METLAEMAEVLPSICFRELDEEFLQFPLCRRKAVQEPDPPFGIPSSERF